MFEDLCLVFVEGKAETVRWRDTLGFCVTGAETFLGSDSIFGSRNSSSAVMDWWGTSFTCWPGWVWSWT